ncbi:sulfatase [Flagellimonas myxillae]|uniref:sulfatase n=1 Tax=Flagellimonas myxillae TaxID=2942214 RepID=UPI00201F7350|nr:sulfatase [Muricauda myxillae]MCL6265851.1 sulfatase [Muricauda myxillae]
MKHLHKILLASLGMILVGCSSKEKAPERPNFLFILVDDLGYSDLSANGSQYYETPHIDNIANQGVNFTNGYATCAVCSPSRASLLTGKYTTVHGITDWIGAKTGTDWREANRFTKLLPPAYTPHLPYDYITLPEALKERDYNTFFAGKWHLGSASNNSLPTDHGFDINQGGYHAGGPYSGGYFSPFNNPYLTDHEDEKGMSLSMKLAKETSKFIKQNKGVPFLAYLSFYAVHGPIQTSQEKWAKYRDKAESMGIQEKGFEMERILPIRKYQDNPVYAGLIEQVDEAVGSVMQTLDELDLKDNTVIIFTSDNGGVASGDNYSTNSLSLSGGKGYQWEGGTRVPFFISIPWSDLKGVKNSTPVNGNDFYPTILELAGVESSEQVDGTSLVPLLSSQEIVARPLFWHYPHYGNQGGEPSSIVREGNWKLIHYWEDGHNELYDLEIDLKEQNNVADARTDITASLNSKLMQWLEDTNAKIPTADPLFDADSLQMKLDYYRNTLMPNLEEGRAQMLQKDWQPNDDWWGSGTNVP